MQPQKWPPRAIPVAKLPMQPFKSPAVAAAIAALSPGSGQLWVGHLGRGLLMFGLSFLCGVGYFWGIFDAYTLAQQANEGKTHASDKYVLHAFITLPLILIIIVGVIAGGLVWHEWEMIRAYLENLYRIQ